MWKNRLDYGILTVLTAVLLFFSGKPFLLTVLFLLLLLLPVARGLLRKDAGQIKISIEKGTPAAVTIETENNLRVTDRIQVELEIHNEMFDQTEQQKFLLPVKGKRQTYTLPVELPLCGQIRFTSTGIWVMDLLGLFKAPVKAGQNFYTVVYPPKMKIQMQQNAGVVGSSQTDGLLQNKKGNDPSEMFELRDYVPGDDIRSIHWKLTSKTEELVIRQASDPSHHTILLLPDFGLDQLARSAGKQEMNTIVAAGVETARSLLKKGKGFTFAIPTRNGLQMYEIQNEKEFSRMLPRWFAVPVQAVSGTGLEYFQMQHMEQYFNRIILLSSGDYEQGLRGLDQKISFTVIQSAQGKELSYTSLKQNGVLIEIPAKANQEETYQILC